MKIPSAVLVTTVLAGLALTPVTSLADVELNDPIKIALFDWTSVNLNAKILGGILEKLGYTVEYPTGRLSFEPHHRSHQWRPDRRP